MTYLTRLSFLSDGASGSAVYDGARQVGWMHPGSIGLCGLASEAVAVVAAGLAHREWSRWLGAKTGEPLPASTIDRLVVARIGQSEWVTKGDTAIARLYRPRGHNLSGEPDAAYAIELLTLSDAANPSGCSSPTRAWRAAYTAVRGALGAGDAFIDQTPDSEQPAFKSGPAPWWPRPLRSVGVADRKSDGWIG